MRTNGWLILLACIFIAGRVSISSSASSGGATVRSVPAPVRPPRMAAPPAVMPRALDAEDEIVDGYGPNQAAASKMAWKNAEERVEKLLVDRFGDRGWRPMKVQLTPEYLKRFGVVQPQGKAQPAPGVDGDAMVVRYRIELTPEYLREVKRVAREQLVQERHFLLARILGGVVVVLLVLVGYLRLEDMTRGYATQLLRLAAIGVVAVTGLALWLTA